MEYKIRINKSYRYTKSYNILKKVGTDTNFLSKFMQKIADKYLMKQGKGHA